MKSDSEWIPSATIALLRPTTPATILAAESMRLVKNPTQVTRAAFFSRAMSIISFGSFIVVGDKRYKYRAFLCYLYPLFVSEVLIYIGSILGLGVRVMKKGDSGFYFRQFLSIFEYRKSQEICTSNRYISVDR